MLDNIRAHSILVARVAITLAGELEKIAADQKQRPSLPLITAGALLHDIAKTLCIKTGCRHAEHGQAICAALGHHEVAEIVAEHVVLSSFQRELYQRGIFPAKELVYYSDKRVNHDRIVSLDDRLDYIRTRYGQDEPKKIAGINRNFTLTKELEEHLFARLKFSPEELESEVAKAALPL
jgi:hypothetical protein